MQDAIIAHSVVVQVARNSALYRVGDEVVGLYAALAGDLRIYVYAEGNERIFLRPLGPTAWFGDIHLLNGHPHRTFEVWSATQSAVLFLPRAGYETITRDPDAYRRFVNLACLHAVHATRVVIEARADARVRTARALLRLAKAHGRHEPRGCELVMKLTQSDLASLVGVSRQFMNELIAAWNSEGRLIWESGARPVIALDRIEDLLTPLDHWIPDNPGWV
ncbi:MAG TPA: Crp/Fnr family transcriptional regulator [Rhizomicrobium sp.]